MFIEEQLSFLHLLQTIRGPHVDAVLRILNLLDTAYFAIALLPFVWIGCSWRWGARLFYLFTLNEFVNHLLKQIFQVPRPFYFDPHLAVLKVSGFSFPSGGAQTAMLLGLLLISYGKGKYIRIFGLFYIFFASVVRMLLGVHFPMDILGGWVVGFLLFLIFKYFHEPLEKETARAPLKILSIVLFLSTLPLLFDRLHSFVSFITISLGIYFSTEHHLYFPPPARIWQKISLGLFATALAFFIGYITTTYLDPDKELAFFFIAVWISLLASPLCKKMAPAWTKR
ncbi:MAG: phosphatase PAP2 family protein [Verrucomicrobia bacterium]|nr:phosphatase PAP2 family protein [Verrucomicrobiota bacterium]